MSRARQLAGAFPAASQPLAFYAAVAATQSGILERHPDVIGRGETFTASLDVDLAARAVPELIEGVRDPAPRALAAALEALNNAGAGAWRQLLADYWTHGDAGDPVRAFAAEALLQPFAEAIAQRERPPGPVETGACPVCARRPFVALLREEGQSAKRSLVCGLCLTEWRAPRLACVACGETTFEKLPVYTAADFPVARLDCCESCRTYIKTIDLTHDGTAIPLVDDIATLSLDVWAREQGFRRIRPNLLRL